MSNAWFKFFGRDWRDGTRAMSCEQRGAYISILTLIYESEDGRLKDDDQHIAYHAGIPLRLYRRLKSELVSIEKLTIADGFLTNERAAKEIYRSSIVALKRHSSGTKGGLNSGLSRAKSRKTKESDEAIASDLLPYARAFPEHRTQKEIDKSISSPRDARSRKKNRFVATDQTLPPEPSAAMVEFATKHGFVNGSLANQFQRWRDWHIGNGVELADADATFRTWIGRAVADRAKAPAPQRSGPPANGIYPMIYK